ncbi:sulfite exporter TauE/SafE family protein [Ottowia thiooxydans]|uniref:sulfite exporter TauE/SafE family protein n=1 Tax=Ottowia thiooxydans TaxID=219182 RepID=UPI00048A5877|nr:sulfite exporter TauE/SafE family protein [Ottowia thiooxydans]
MIALSLLFLLALCAGVLSGVVGTGSSLIMLPVLVAQYGPRIAVPVMAIASLLGNIGRVIVWWHEIRWRPVLAYSLTGVPAAMLGAHTLMSVPPVVVDVFLAAFFLAMIPLRRLLRRSQIHLRVWHMAVAGGIVGFLTGFVLSTGPLSVPIFTGYGMSGGAFLGSEAASAVLLYAGKLGTFGVAGVLTPLVIARGLAIGLALLVGSMIAKRLVQRLQTHTFEFLIDAVLVAGAASMIAPQCNCWAMH